MLTEKRTAKKNSFRKAREALQKDEEMRSSTRSSLLEMSMRKGIKRKKTTSSLPKRGFCSVLKGHKVKTLVEKSIIFSKEL